MKTKLLMYLLLFLSLAVYVACFFGIRSNVEQSLSLLVASLLVIYAFILWCINSKVFIPKNDMNLKVDMKIFFGYGINHFVFMFISSIILIQWMHHIHVVIEANGITNIQVILLGILGFFYLLYAAYQILGEHTQIFFSKIPYVHKRWMKAVMIFFCVVSASYNHSLVTWGLQTISMLAGAMFVVFVIRNKQQQKKKARQKPNYCDYFQKPRR